MTARVAHFMKQLAGLAHALAACAGFPDDFLAGMARRGGRKNAEASEVGIYTAGLSASGTMSGCILSELP